MTAAASPAAIPNGCSGSRISPASRTKSSSRRIRAIVYDHAIRMSGVKDRRGRTWRSSRPHSGPRTAMVYILGGPGDDGPLGTRGDRRGRKRQNVPVLVDAAAEILTESQRVPGARRDGWPTAAASACAARRRPGCCSARRPAPGRLAQQRAASCLRPFAEGRQGRDHGDAGRGGDVDQARPQGRMEAVGSVAGSHRRSRSKRSNGVTTKIIQPNGGSLEPHAVALRIQWDGASSGSPAPKLRRLLLDTEPRIVVAGGTGTPRTAWQARVTITPYMMIPEDEKVVADDAIRFR